MDWVVDKLDISEPVTICQYLSVCPILKFVATYPVIQKYAASCRYLYCYILQNALTTYTM